MKKIIPTILNYEEQINRDFVRATIVVMDYTQIANGTHFSKEAIIEAMNSLNYIPVIGYWKDSDNDFQGHGIDYYIENGELKKEVKTIPYGVVINNTGRFETRTINGQDREVLVCDCYLWEDRYPNQIDKVKENLNTQSMEISIDEYKDMGQYIEITKFNFDALCILGTVNPAFKVGSIKVNSNYSKENDFKAEYQKMLNALDKYLNYEEGSKKSDMENNKEKELEQEEFACDDKKKKVCEDKEEEIKDKEKMEEETEDEEEEFACNKKKKQLEDDKSEKEYEAKIEALNKNYSELQEKYSSLENDSNELKAKYEQLLDEVTGLRQYKADKEAEYRQAEEQRIFAQFEDIKETEQFNKIVENKAEYSLEELEEKCYALYGKLNKEKFSKNKSKQKESNPVVDKVYSAEGLENNKLDKVSSLIEKYSKR